MRLRSVAGGDGPSTHVVTSGTAGRIQAPGARAGRSQLPSQSLRMAHDAGGGRSQAGPKQEAVRARCSVTHECNSGWFGLVSSKSWFGWGVWASHLLLANLCAAATSRFVAGRPSELERELEATKVALAKARESITDAEADKVEATRVEAELRKQLGEVTQQLQESKRRHEETSTELAELRTEMEKNTWMLDKLHAVEEQVASLRATVVSLNESRSQADGVTRAAVTSVGSEVATLAEAVGSLQGTVEREAVVTRNTSAAVEQLAAPVGSCLDMSATCVEEQRSAATTMDKQREALLALQDQLQEFKTAADVAAAEAVAAATAACEQSQAATTTTTAGSPVGRSDLTALRFELKALAQVSRDTLKVSQDAARFSKAAAGAPARPVPQQAAGPGTLSADSVAAIADAVATRVAAQLGSAQVASAQQVPAPRGTQISSTEEVRAQKQLREVQRLLQVGGFRP